MEPGFRLSRGQRRGGLQEESRVEIEQEAAEYLSGYDKMEGESRPLSLRDGEGKRYWGCFYYHFSLR